MQNAVGLGTKRDNRYEFIFLLIVAELLPIQRKMLSSQSINRSMGCLLTKLSRTNKIPEERVLPVFKNNRPNNKQSNMASLFGGNLFFGRSFI